MRPDYLKRRCERRDPSRRSTDERRAELACILAGGLRVHAGPGYRVYFARRGSALVILLAGGDKQSQRRDIGMAKKLAAELRDLQELGEEPDQ